MAEQAVKTKAPPELSIKHKLFAQKLVEKKGNVAEAYVDAGYTAKNKEVAISAGNRLLSNVAVKNEVKTVLSNHGLSVDDMSKELKKSISAGVGERATNADALRGIEMVMRLHDAFPAQRKQVEQRSVSLVVEGKSVDELGSKLDELLDLAKGIRDTK